MFANLLFAGKERKQRLEFFNLTKGRK